jgi:DHA2 family multidrug resistance protein
MEKSFSLLVSTILSNVIVIFNLSLAITASIHIVSDLGGGLDISFYDFSFFAIGNAVGFPLGKIFIAKAFHRWSNKEEVEGKPVNYLVGSLYLFLLFSILCGCSPNYPIFLIFRFLQGFCAGPLIPLQQELCTYHLSKEQNNSLTKTFSLIFTLGPTFFSAIAGWIAYESHWRLLFLFNIPLLLYLIFFIKHRRAIYDAPVKKEPFDLIGYICFTSGLLLLGLALVTSQNLDWQRSPLFMTLFITGSIFFIFFIIWEFIHPYPLLGIKFVKEAGKAVFTTILIVVFSVYYGANFLVAQWLHLDVNYTPLWVGDVVVYSILAALVIFFFIYRLLRKKPLWMLFLSLLFLTAASFYSSQFNIEVNFGRVLSVKVLESIGFCLFFLSILELFLDNVGEESHKHLLATLNITRLFFTGLGSAIFSIIWQRRQAFYHERLGEQLTALSPQTDEFFTKTNEYFIEGSHAQAELALQLNRQSKALALEDVFYLMGWLLVSLLVLLIIAWVRKHLRSQLIKGS